VEFVAAHTGKREEGGVGREERRVKSIGRVADRRGERVEVGGTEGRRRKGREEGLWRRWGGGKAVWRKSLGWKAWGG